MAQGWTVVTGASRGIGRGIAEALGTEGARVAINYRVSTAAAEEIVESIRSFGQEAIAVQADVAEEGDVKRMVDTVLRYPDEVTALAAGAALYLLRVRNDDADNPCLPLSALVMENAAAQLHRRTDAALRFRELLRLNSPWP